jgi:prepilin-type N-terminal cleavage/methylation domain-containing protein
MPKNNGFSLIETLIAIALFGVASTSLVTMRLAAYDNLRQARQLSESANALIFKMEETLSKPYAQIPGVEITPGLKKVSLDSGSYCLFYRSS